MSRFNERLALAASGERSITSLIEEDVERLRETNARYDYLSTEASDCLARARQLDEMTPADRGPLAGLSFTAKDWISVAGLPAGRSFGAPLERIAKRDATVVARLRQAGGILLGITRAVGDGDEAPGPVNPRANGHTPGASSRGDAVAVACGGAFFGIGSDSGGSIRWPAHCCGVVGYKPSSGRVPSTGHVPPIIGLTDPRTVIGPLVARVDDLLALMPIVSGADGIDATVTGWAEPTVRRLDKMRIAVFDRFDDAEPDDETTRVCAAAAARLQTLGMKVSHEQPPLVETAFAITRAYWRRPESVSNSTWAPPYPSSLTADEVEKSLFDWDHLRRSFFAFMQDFDAIVCPVAATPAPALEPDYRVGAEDYRYTLPFSLTGQPVIAVPAGTSLDGRPIGLQVVGRLHGDEDLPAIARAIETAPD